MKYYLAIDNGLDGGICLTAGQSGSILYCKPMPVEELGKGRQVDFMAVQNLILSWIAEQNIVDLTALIEKPNNAQTPSTGASMASSFARCECALIQLRLPYEHITPQKWQKEFWRRPKMPKGKKFDTKAAALNAARKIWPKQEWPNRNKTQKAYKAHDGCVDAALIAEYGRRKNY